MTLNAVSLDLSSNPEEGMDVCKCIGPLLHEGTLNRRRIASSLVKLVEVEEKWEPLTTPGCSPLKLGGTVLNRTVTCMVLKTTANDRRTSSPLP
ncbi:hypothetical protein TNCV_605301 [Trichonephila clavipes]|nr:hypothetical protein TNCV_605301 [Trichonephila clavipes]